jgi:hypothetical protein
MGDFRITIEGVGGHGCGREAKAGETVTRCKQPGCPDCIAVEFVEKLKAGNSISLAVLAHWPVPGAGCGRTANPGPIDDLLTGTRDRSF